MSEQLRADVRAFLDDELASGGFVPHCDAWLSEWDEDFTKRMAARGWIGMTVPPEYGGPGRPAADRYVVVEEMLAAGAPVAAHWVADRQVVPTMQRGEIAEHALRKLCLRLGLMFQMDEKERFLAAKPGLGDKIGLVPGTGSDVGEHLFVQKLDRGSVQVCGHFRQK